MTWCLEAIVSFEKMQSRCTFDSHQSRTLMKTPKIIVFIGSIGNDVPTHDKRGDGGVIRQDIVPT